LEIANEGRNNLPEDSFSWARLEFLSILQTNTAADHISVCWFPTKL